MLHEFYRYEKNPTDDMRVHIRKIDSMRNAIADIDKKMDDELYQVTLLGFLPK